MKRVLTIAGSDSGGGAGIQADIKTISAIGCYAASAITAVTAQNTLGVVAVEALSPEIVEQQIRAVLDDIGADAVKIGMLANTEIVELVAALMREYDPPFIVLDPVLVATSGDRLTRSSATEAILSQATCGPSKTFPKLSSSPAWRSNLRSPTTPPGRCSANRERTPYCSKAATWTAVN